MALQDYYNTGDNEQGLASAPYEWKTAQTFVASSAYDLTSVKLKVKYIQGSGNFTVSIQGVDGSGFPDGSVLVSKTVAHTELPSADFGWFDFIFVTTPTLTPSAQYAIVFEASDSAEAFWRYHSGGATYADGKACAAAFGGAWDNQPNEPADFMFEVYGDIYDPNKYLSALLSSTLSAQASCNLDLVMGAGGLVGFQMFANLDYTRDVLLTADIPITVSGSAALPAFWRAPVETGMRNYLVAAIKNKLYYGS